MYRIYHIMPLQSCWFSDWRSGSLRRRSIWMPGIKIIQRISHFPASDCFSLVWCWRFSRAKDIFWIYVFGCFQLLDLTPYSNIIQFPNLLAIHVLQIVYTLQIESTELIIWVGLPWKMCSKNDIYPDSKICISLHPDTLSSD